MVALPLKKARFSDDTAFANVRLNATDMLIIFISYLLVLALLLFAMINDRRARTEGKRFLNSVDFWEAYIICICLAALFYLITTSEEIQLSDSISFN